jgi:hypothetical protein
MSKERLCRWNCGRKTNRRCGICLQCCDKRDERNRRIDAGLQAYVPPEKRPGHRFYKGEKRERTEKQKAALSLLNLRKPAKSAKRMPQAETF